MYDVLNATTATDADMLAMLLQHQKAIDALLGSVSVGTVGSVASLLTSTDLLRSGLDASWVLIGSYLVFLMSLGFGLVEAGSVKAINAKNILYQCALVTCSSIITFWIWGYGMTQGTSMGFGDMSESATLSAAQYPMFLFLWGFAQMAGLIVTGSVTSRVNMLTFFVLITVVTSFIFPMVAFWLWSSGFLSVHMPGAMQIIDYSGGLAVHVVGGVAAFTAAYIIGPRYDRFEFNTETGATDDRKEPGHSVVFAIIGTFLLWFAWFGYTSASSGGLTDGRNLVAGLAAVNTLLAAGVGSLSITAWRMCWDDVHNLWELLNGILCGLVAISPAAATVEPWAAILIGAGSAFAYRGGVRFLKWMRVDDVIEGFAVHGCCAAYGVVVTAFFSTQTYCDQLYGVDVLNFNVGHQLGVQLLGLVCTAVFTIIATALPLLLLKRFCGLRVSLEDEQLGLDAALHGGYAYPDFKAKMAILKSQVVLEAELGAAVKSSAVGKAGDAVTEKIRNLDEMRKDLATNEAARDRMELSTGGPPSKKKQTESIIVNHAVAQQPGSQKGILRQSGQSHLGVSLVANVAHRKYLASSKPEVESDVPSPSVVAWRQDDTTKEGKLTNASSYSIPEGSPPSKVPAKGTTTTTVEYSVEVVRIRISNVQSTTAEETQTSPPNVTAPVSPSSHHSSPADSNGSAFPPPRHPGPAHTRNPSGRKRASEHRLTPLETESIVSPSGSSFYVNPLSRSGRGLESAVSPSNNPRALDTPGPDGAFSDNEDESSQAREIRHGRRVTLGEDTIFEIYQGPDPRPNSPDQ